MGANKINKIEKIEKINRTKIISNMDYYFESAYNNQKQKQKHGKRKIKNGAKKNKNRKNSMMTVQEIYTMQKSNVANLKIYRKLRETNSNVEKSDNKYQIRRMNEAYGKSQIITEIIPFYNNYNNKAKNEKSNPFKDSLKVKEPSRSDTKIKQNETKKKIVGIDSIRSSYSYKDRDKNKVLSLMPDPYKKAWIDFERALLEYKVKNTREKYRRASEFYR